MSWPRPCLVDWIPHIVMLYFQSPPRSTKSEQRFCLLLAYVTALEACIHWRALTTSTTRKMSQCYYCPAEYLYKTVGTSCYPIGHRGKRYCARAASLFPRKLCARALCLKPYCFGELNPNNFRPGILRKLKLTRESQGQKSQYQEINIFSVRSLLHHILWGLHQW